MLKRYFLNSIEVFIESGHKFSHLIEMKGKRNTNKRYMKYEYYINQHMQARDIKLNEIVAQNPQLIEALDRIIVNP